MPSFISSQAVLNDLTNATIYAYETHYGNRDMWRGLNALGLAGAFTVIDPWHLQEVHLQEVHLQEAQVQKSYLPEEDVEKSHLQHKQNKARNNLIHAGGYAAVPFGEKYPPLLEFIQAYWQHSKQLALPQQSIASWRAALAHNLVALLTREAPQADYEGARVFFSNSGAEAIEAALKFAATKRPKADYLINFQHAYHGKTTGALALTPNPAYQQAFQKILPQQHVLTLPFGDSEALAHTLKRVTVDKINAIILEPVQGEAGVIVPPKDFLPYLEQLRQDYGISIIADEIQTGLGRTGEYFYSLAHGLMPDIITLAKPLGGGIVPIGATIVRKNYADRMLGGFHCKRHSSTFAGGSLAMAIGLKSLEIIAQEGLVARAKEQGAYALTKLQTLQQQYPNFFRQVRGVGMLFALELRPAVPAALSHIAMTQQLSSLLGLAALHRGGIHACLSLNANRIIRLTPALNMPKDVLADMLARLEHIAQTHQRKRDLYQHLSLADVRVLLELALI